MTPVIVAVGASAGGQQAFERFFAHVPVDSGMAFVLIQHLDPHHTSLLARLVQRFTALPVQEVQDNVEVEPNHVYVIAPGANLAIFHGKLHLMEFDPVEKFHTPVNYFFHSLAVDQGDLAVGIVLSGGGADGADGIRAIKAAGGLTMAQLPETALHRSMPEHAIATGDIDRILAPEVMPNILAQHVGDMMQTTWVQVHDPWKNPSFQKIFVLLRDRTGHDFTRYRQTMIGRRIGHRMVAKSVKTPEAYYQLILDEPEELDALFNNLLIGVTSFFRDADAFARLEALAIKPLVANHRVTEPLRVWVVGCATGEEAYSIAILLREEMTRRQREFPVQIFATDINADAIDAARRGRFPSDIVADVAPARLERFFVPVDGGYDVRREIRNMLIFSIHDVARDPPFSRIDLISCRNLLIYFEPSLQKLVVRVFAYALNNRGYLFLGKSGNPDHYPALFTVLDRRMKIFRRTSEPSRGLPYFPLMATAGTHSDYSQGGNSVEFQSRIREAIETALLAQAPTSVVVNREGDVVYIHGHSGRYLELPSGENLRLNVLSLARPELRGPLGAALEALEQEQALVLHESVQIQSDDNSVWVRVTVEPLSAQPDLAGYVLIQFRDISALSDEASSGDVESLLQQRERELSDMRLYLQSTIRQLEAANEELTSTNEELQSTNEEMQSSHEELQSVNEELVTLNSDYEMKIADLTLVNDDLNNVLTRIDLGIIFLDSALRFRLFNDSATRIAKLIDSDIGRPLGDIVTNLRYDRLVGDAREVLETLVTKEIEVEGTEGSWFWVTIRPYRTAANMIDGVMITAADITAQKRVQFALAQAQREATMHRDLAESIVNTIDDPLLVLDAHLNVIAMNRAFGETFRVDPAAVVDRQLDQVTDRLQTDPPLPALLQAAIATDDAAEGLASVVLAGERPAKQMEIEIRKLRQSDERLPLILLVLKDKPNNE